MTSVYVCADGVPVVLAAATAETSSVELPVLVRWYLRQRSMPLSTVVSRARDEDAWYVHTSDRETATCRIDRRPRRDFGIGWR